MPTTLQFRLFPHRPNLQPLAIFLQHTLIVVFPKLLCRILARNSLQYLRATGMFVNEVCDVVDVFVYDDVHALVG